MHTQSMLLRIPKILLLLFIPILHQCDKLNQYDPIVFGELNQNLTVQEFDTVIRYQKTYVPYYPFYGYGTVDFALDLDLDKTDDIILSNGNANDKWGISSVCSLTLTNESFELAVSHTSDTIFYCGYSDTTSYGYDSLYYTLPLDITCQYSSGIHKISNSVYPDIFHLKDSLSDHLEWVSEQTLITLEVKDYWRLSCNDQQKLVYNTSVGINANDPDQYIAVRKRDNDEYRYGWIKIGTDGGPFIRLKGCVMEI